MQKCSRNLLHYLTHKHQIEEEKKKQNQRIWSTILHRGKKKKIEIRKTYRPWKALLSLSQSCDGDGTISGILRVSIGKVFCKSSEDEIELINFGQRWRWVCFNCVIINEDLDSFKIYFSFFCMPFQFTSH